jgi:Ca2+-binding RTX toxin-like protein
MAENGKFQSAYVSRINDDFIEDHVPATLRGNGYGDWSCIGSDLVVSAAPSASAVWDNGSLKLNFSYTVTNSGIVTAGATQTGIYLSRDNQLDAKDEFLTWDAVAALNSGISSKETFQFTRVAGDLASGTYYLFAVADGAYAVTETNENNNVSPAGSFFVPPQIISDLDITSTPVLQIVWAAAGGSYNLTYSITNRGTTGTTPATHAGIYLSTDSTITTADRLVAVDNVANLLAGATSGEGGTFVLPGNVAAGNYYIGVIADYDKAVAETDETNNVSSAVRITVVTEGADRIVATTAEKSWHGLGGNDTITGTTGRDALYGDDGGDSLLGGGGNDTLIGGNGADALSGGAGADYFQFNSAAEIGTRAGSRDRIIDWNPADDYIDLRPIDARAGTTANDAFTFVAAQGATFSGAKGQLRWVIENNASTSNDRTLVMGDIDGNRQADFVIEISGLHTMRAVDFLL